ncbi:MAG: hypothetical protein WC915_01890 [archaeon]|jgi:hypothetical protein
MENQVLTKSFSNAIRSPPAFTGSLVDWSINSREITATIIDLIVRDLLSISNDKIFITKKTIGLKKFEKTFISILFKNKKSLTFNELKNQYKKYSNELIKIICIGLIDNDIIQKDFQKKLAGASKKAMEETLGFVPKIPSNAKRLDLPEWILRPLLSVMGLKPMFDNMSDNAKKNLGKPFEDVLLTQKGKLLEQESVALKEFMKNYPMSDERLANEFIGHSIVFGIGEFWINKFGDKNIKLKELFDMLDTQEAKIMNFVDMDEYLKEFN